MKVWFASNVLRVAGINFHQTCQICFVSTLLMTETGYPIHVPHVICLINQVSPAAMG